MAGQARFGADRVIAAVADEMQPTTVGHWVEDAAEPSRLFVDLCGAQIRHCLEIATALTRMIVWEDIVRAQGELFWASLVCWSRWSSKINIQQEQGRSTSVPGHPVRAVMKRHCTVLAQPGETVQTAVARMTKAACGSILVCDGDHLCGIFTERDLVTRVVGCGRDPKRTRLAEVMTCDPAWIESSETVREALWQMDGFAYPLPVLEDGRALGVLSLHDLPLETLAEMLPELEQRRVLAERIW